MESVFYFIIGIIVVWYIIKIGSKLEKDDEDKKNKPWYTKKSSWFLGIIMFIFWGYILGVMVKGCGNKRSSSSYYFQNEMNDNYRPDRGMRRR